MNEVIAGVEIPELFKTELIAPGALVVPYGTMSAVELSLTDIMTTGLGSRSSYALPREELAEFSVRTVRGRAKTAQALVAEIRALSTPVCMDPRHGADGAEDDSTNAALGARRLTRLLDRLRHLLALEAVTATQAMDLAAPAVLGRGPEFLHHAIRKVVPRLDDDRPCGADVERVVRDVLAATAVQETIRALLAANG